MDSGNLNKKLKIKGQNYEYDGPNHPQILDLLNYMEEDQENYTEEENTKSLNSCQRIHKKINDYFIKNYTFKDGKYKFRFPDFIFIFSFLLILISEISATTVTGIFLFFFSNSFFKAFTTNPIVKESFWKLFLAKYSSIFLLILTFYIIM